MSKTKSTARIRSIRVVIDPRAKSLHVTKSLNSTAPVRVTRTRRSRSLIKDAMPSQSRAFEKATKETYSPHLSHIRSKMPPPVDSSPSNRQVQILANQRSPISMANNCYFLTAQRKLTKKNEDETIDMDSKITRNTSSIESQLAQKSPSSFAKVQSMKPTISIASVSQDLRSSTNLMEKRPLSARHIRSIFPNDSNQLRKEDTAEKSKRKRRRFGAKAWYRCTPCCAALSVLSSLLLLTAVAALLIALIGTKVSSTTTTTIKVTVTTTTATQTTTTSTTSTTTTVFNCGPSCLYQSWIDTSGGLAWWPFDGSYTDRTGIYDGYPSTSLPSFAPGYINQAVLFNASGLQKIFTPFIPLNNVSFTVEAWINPTAYPNPSDHSLVGLCPSQTTNFCLHINIRNQKLYFGFFFNDVAGTTMIALNQWIHTAFVFDRPTMTQTIYLNGFQNGQNTVSSVLQVTSGNFTIGTNEGVVTPNNYYQGYIDELSINQRPMSSCEVLERATLAAHFRFDTLLPYNDSGPNAVSSTYSSTSIVSGYRNQAISFVGSSSSYFQASGLTSLGISNQAFSITFWLKPQALSGTLVHLSSSPAGTGSTCFPVLGFAASGAIVAQVLTTPGTVVTATGPILPVSSSWIPVVQTWSVANGLRLYVNNTLVSSVAASTFLGSGTTPNYATLGGCLSGCGGACTNGLVGAPGFFTGAIDDWRIYSRELTAVDVCALYHGV